MNDSFFGKLCDFVIQVEFVHLFSHFAVHHVLLALESDDGVFDSVEKGPLPGDGTGHRGLALVQRRVALLFLEHVVHCVHLQYKQTNDVTCFLGVVFLDLFHVGHKNLVELLHQLGIDDGT